MKSSSGRFFHLIQSSHVPQSSSAGRAILILTPCWRYSMRSRTVRLLFQKSASNQSIGTLRGRVVSGGSFGGSESSRRRSTLKTKNWLVNGKKSILSRSTFDIFFFSYWHAGAADLTFGKKP